MSHTVPNQHPAVVLRSSYQHLRAILAIAIAVILGLTIAVVVLATHSNHGAPADSTIHSALRPNPSAEAGATLDHSGRNTGGQMTSSLVNYPDAPQPSATATQRSMSYYLDAPQP